MTVRSVLPALPLLALAAAVRAAPPLSIPIPRPTPEQEALMVAEAEEDQLREEAEEARLREEAALAEPETAPEPEPETAPAPGPAPAPAPGPAPAPAPEPVVPAPAPVVAPVAAPAPAPAAISGAAPPPAIPVPDSPPAAANDDAVFRRDPFWSVAVSRARKADYDARAAARAEAAARAAAIEKARQEAIARGEDVLSLDDDELAARAGDAAGPSGPKSSSKFGGATDGQWDAALAKIPPRSGYFGGKKPALMLKGDKRPHYVGDELCVTNRGIVFTWRISSVDFRAYAHELERVSATPLP